MFIITLHKIIDKPDPSYEFGYDGMFCDVWYVIKQKHPHIMDRKDTAYIYILRIAVLAARLSPCK